MKKNVIVFLLIFSSIGSSFAQGDFRPGYIENNGDTIHGFIAYKIEKNYKACSFKKSSGTEAITYGPEDIDSYRFEGDKLFEAAYVKADQDSIKVFLEVIVQGKASLYHYLDRFFVRKEQSTLYELEETEEAVERGGTTYKTKNRRYILLLRYLLNNCPSLADRIDNMSLTQKKLTRLIEGYNECVGSAYVTYKKNKPLVASHYGLLSVYSKSKLKFYAHLPEYKPMEARDFNTSSVGIGMFLDISSPKINERLSFHSELWCAYYRYQVSFTQPTIAYNWSNHYDITIKLLAFQLPMAIRYGFLNEERKINPYLELGVDHHIMGSGSIQIIKELMHKEGTTEKKVETEKYEPSKISRYHVGLLGGVGASFRVKNKSLFGGIRIERGYRLTSLEWKGYKDIVSKPTDVNLLLGIRL